VIGPFEWLLRAVTSRPDRFPDRRQPKLLEPARIVLVKPGDVLVLGNVSLPSDSKHMEKVLTFFQDHFGLAEIVVFEDDIELAVQRGSGS
jgi:hypothetical protein